MNEYLIPANSKKSMLILGMFNKGDLIIFGAGLGATILMMLTMSANSLKQILFILSPALICSFLVVPIPNQHNIRTLIQNIYLYFTGRRTYYWKGWCGGYGEDDTK